MATKARDPSTRVRGWRDRKSTRLNSSHSQISYAVFCLKKKKISVTQSTCPPTYSPSDTPHPLRTTHLVQPMGPLADWLYPKGHRALPRTPPFLTASHPQ